MEFLIVLNWRFYAGQWRIVPMSFGPGCESGCSPASSLSEWRKMTKWSETQILHPCFAPSVPRQRNILRCPQSYIRLLNEEPPPPHTHTLAGSPLCFALVADDIKYLMWATCTLVFVVVFFWWRKGTLLLINNNVRRSRAAPAIQLSVQNKRIKGNISQRPLPALVPVLCTSEEELEGAGEGVGIFCRLFSPSSSSFLVSRVIGFRLNAIFSLCNPIPLPVLSCFYQQWSFFFSLFFFWSKGKINSE